METGLVTLHIAQLSPPSLLLRTQPHHRTFLSSFDQLARRMKTPMSLSLRISLDPGNACITPDSTVPTPPPAAAPLAVAAGRDDRGATTDWSSSSVAAVDKLPSSIDDLIVAVMVVVAVPRNSAFSRRARFTIVPEPCSTAPAAEAAGAAEDKVSVTSADSSCFRPGELGPIDSAGGDVINFARSSLLNPSWRTVRRRSGVDANVGFGRTDFARPLAASVSVRKISENSLSTAEDIVDIGAAPAAAGEATTMESPPLSTGANRRRWPARRGDGSDDIECCAVCAFAPPDAAFSCCCCGTFSPRLSTRIDDMCPHVARNCWQVCFLRRATGEC